MLNTHTVGIALKAHFDWLIILKITFAVHFGTTCVGFGPENIVIQLLLKEMSKNHLFVLY